MADNNIFDFVKFGLNIDTSVNITIVNNWVFIINSRHLVIASGSTTGDPIGAMIGCAKILNDACTDVRMFNNLVGGVEATGVDSTGYSVHGHECNNYNAPTFKDNIAHSINGYGAIIFINKTAQSV